MKPAPEPAKDDEEDDDSSEEEVEEPPAKKAKKPAVAIAEDSDDDEEEEVEDDEGEEEEEENDEGEESEEEAAPKKGESLKVFVGNIPWAKEEEAAIRKFFGKCGEIESMELPTKLAFVTFKKKGDMEKALELHG